MLIHPTPPPIEAEKRYHTRVFFSEDARISANFSHLDTEWPDFPAIVMNMSEGGIGVTTRARFSGNLSQGQRLQLTFVQVAGTQSRLTNLLTRVQWMVEEEMSDKLLLGLEFRGVDAVTRLLITRFMEKHAPG